MAKPFESPLRITVRTPFTAFGFGPVVAEPQVAALRGELNAHLNAVADRLPAPLRAEARWLLRGYAGGADDFFRLFYVPSWSFLHWAAVAAPALLSPASLRDACEAHALALFLHLWDDHLCDRQLETDLLRLQLRTVAWARFDAACRRLCAGLGEDPTLVDRHADTYLSSLHRPAPVTELAAYTDRFRQQVAIWTVVPRLLSADLSRIIAEFAVAWRLLDDLQDIHLDVAEGKQTAVWLALDGEGRRRWQACCQATAEAGRLDSGSWEALGGAIWACGCPGRLMAEIDARLQLATGLAERNGWTGLARELMQCGRLQERQ